MAPALIEPVISKRYDDVAEVKSTGATYTPQELADFTAKQLLAIARLPAGRPIRVLDPALGDGELLNSLLARLDRDVEVYGFETDPHALKKASIRLASRFPNVRQLLVEGSFLDHVLNDFSGGLYSLGERYDLIIANPPYVRTQIIGAAGAQALADQFGLTGRVDLYFAFLLGMARVLTPTGSAGMIVSNRFMTTRAGSTIREALSRELNLRRIFDLGDTKIFDAAVLPAVIIANGRLNAESVSSPTFTTIYETKTKERSTSAASAIAAMEESGTVAIPDGRVFEVQHGILHTDADPASVWRLSSNDVEAWLDTVEANTWSRFRDLGKVRVGVKTCADKIFIRQHWPEPLELLRPLTTHKISRRFRANPKLHAAQILYPHEMSDGRRTASDLTKYPDSSAYLESHREKLESRTYVTEGGRNWYEIWVPQNPEDWQGPKLVFRDICEQPTFWVDLDNTIVNGDCYWLKPNKGKEELLWLALAVGNSTFIEQFYDRRFNNKLYAGRRRFITQYVDKFPLPDPASTISQNIIQRTKLLFYRIEQSGGSALENDIDRLVWQAFGLTPEKV